MLLGRSGPRPLQYSATPQLQHPDARHSELSLRLSTPGQDLRSTTPARPLRSSAALLDQFLCSVALGLASWALVLPLAENRRFLFTYMHLLLSIVVVIVIAVIVSSSTPLSYVSTLLGGITFKSMFYKFASLAQTQTQTQQTQTQTQTQNKNQMCSNCQQHADASPARAVKCLSPVSDRDADTRSRLPVIDSL